MSKLWDHERVIRKIQDRHRAGLALNYVWRDWPGLYRAAQRYCGSWQEAVREAGLESRVYRRWSKERVIKELQTWHRAPPTDMDDWDQGLASATMRFFGSWKKALHAAGLEPRRHRKWTRQRVIRAIQDRHVHGRSINGVEHRNRSLVWAARYYFGGWQQALEAAGLGDQFQVKRTPRPWCREFVVAEIQALHQRGLLLGKVWLEDPTLYSAAKHEFGSWRAAVTEAGFEPARKRWNKEVILAEIRGRRGCTLSSGAPENRNLVSAASRYFGSWRAALQAAATTRNSERSSCHEKK